MLKKLEQPKNKTEAMVSVGVGSKASRNKKKWHSCEVSTRMLGLAGEKSSSKEGVGCRMFWLARAGGHFQGWIRG